MYFRPEDNDDVVEIIDKCRPAMRESFGDFYIAEEVLSDQKDESIIIAEVSCMLGKTIYNFFQTYFEESSCKDKMSCQRRE